MSRFPRTLFDVVPYKPREVPALPAPSLVPGGPPAPAYRAIRRLEAAIPLVLDPLDIDACTSHDWCDGVYRRKFVLPKDAIVVSKVHKKENWFMLASGEVSIASHDGTVVRVKAPYLAVTEPGTKRVVYAHEEAVMYTFHGNPENETDVEKLEALYVLPESKPTLSAPEIRMLLEKQL